MSRLGWYWVLAGAGAACGVALSHFCLSVQVSPLSLLATKLSNTSCKAPTSPAKLCDQGARSAVNEGLRREYAFPLPFSPSVKPLQQVHSNPPLRAPSKHLRLPGQSSHLFLIPKQIHRPQSGEPHDVRIHQVVHLGRGASAHGFCRKVEREGSQGTREQGSDCERHAERRVKHFRFVHAGRKGWRGVRS